MKEIFLISKIPNGYFCGIDYDTNKAVYSITIINSSPQFFDSSFLAMKRLSELKTECNEMFGIYEIIRLILIE